jgi:hypothetical protein
LRILGNINTSLPRISQAAESRQVRKRKGRCPTRVARSGISVQSQTPSKAELADSGKHIRSSPAPQCLQALPPSRIELDICNVQNTSMVLGNVPSYEGRIRYRRTLRRSICSTRLRTRDPLIGRTQQFLTCPWSMNKCVSGEKPRYRSPDKPPC